ncbi:hypothetical protein PHYSODRAFT_337249 [Phytophthora sojae]|uniref:Uncharacterized protein n=1 Tax=Phytophthora sojae (strain P6497) TaxID=1094619 RepID=G4ZZZ6_PHYSP|nr:hypothetical protein PHYSODRAFT_337249 [Phytophthora sojae]EGZ10438.1 hypothetical protein PHYSODRAFT_337249 [Phytophthora sojae]|eukprot:XP_009533183.1 hypothetical protein PHYSODRAFT_337249 [Phytophthora sojae]
MQKEHYIKLLRCIEDCVGRKLTPKEVVCDFEAALIGAIRAYFPDIRIIGCLFHFKQACRRKLKEYQIPRDEAKLAMAPNVFDILTVIDPSKIEVQGIAWVKAKIKKVCEAKHVTYSRRKWRKFWDYFRRTWLEMFPPTYWNVFGMRRDIVSRTNNPLERFHRHLNGKIKAPHPAMSSFVDTLEGISREYVAQRVAIQSGLARPPQRKRFQLPRAPQLPEVGDIVDSEESEDEDEQPTIATDDPASCSSAPGSEYDVAEMDHDTVDYSPDNSFDYDGDASAIV